MRRHGYSARLWALFIVILLTLNLFTPFTAFAEIEKGKQNEDHNGNKIVRVGWHEPPYFMKDSSGRLSGYSYEYQRKVAAYTGWDYEYVEGTWSELLQMLKDGEIDLMSNVSYSDERAQEMLYSSLPMGTEAYYLFVAPDEKDITSDNLTVLNGKRIGVAKGSIQKDFFLDWADKHGLDVSVTELNNPEEKSIRLLGSELDAFVTMDVYGTSDIAVPVCKIGSSDFFFAVSKDRPDLLAELDTALNKIQDENKYFGQQLHDRYLQASETNRFLGASEREWLAEHGTVRVGYQDNYMAFCAADKETGELTGALRDYLDYASTAFENAQIQFEAVPFTTVNDALEALRRGEIDCMFPANLTEYDAEQLGLVITPPLMKSEMDAVVRSSDRKKFLKKKNVTVAVNKGDTNYDLFLAEHYPDWNRVYFDDTPAALDAVAGKKADCVIISSYRFGNISKQCERLHLTTVFTDVEMDYRFAVIEHNTELYSILVAVTGVVPDPVVHKALTYYSTEDAKTSFAGFIKENLFIVTTAVSGVLLAVLILLLRSIRAERKAAAGEHMVKDLKKRVFVDSLTSVRNKGAYTDYIRKLQEGIDSGGQTEFAIGIFDCNDLKYINDRFGHEKGDIYLKSACSLICRVFDHSPVFRIGGDEFAVVLQNNDYENREQLMAAFEDKRREICTEAPNKWEEVHIAAGIAVYDPQLDRSVSETASRADHMMYENKRIAKETKK